MTVMTDEPVAVFGTGLMNTAVSAAPAGGFRWRRSPGPLAPSPFEAVYSTVDTRLAACGDGVVRLVAGAADGDGRIYRADGRESVAARLLAGGAAGEFEPVLRGLGSALRALHDGGLPEHLATRRPRALARIETWLSHGVGNAHAATAQAQLRRYLGAERWARVLSWYDEVRADGDVTLAHGAPGLGSLIAAGTGAVLLTGEDLSAAPWYFDLGWVVGEIVELKWFVNGDAESWNSLMAALFDGYGWDLGERWNRLAVLRIVLHMHDYAAYVGWHTDSFERYCGFVKFLADL